MKTKGLFITFEGPEGSGKSTQSRKLRAYLSSKNIPVVLTKEPGGTLMGRTIRTLLLKPTKSFFSPRAELFLYLADRSQHVDEKILPTLIRGGVVISDRFTDATLAYQGFGRVLGTKKLGELNKLATNGIVPDITFFLDVPPEKGLSTARRTSAKTMRYKKGDRMEQETIRFHNKVYKGYISLSRKYPERIKRIPGIGGREAIFNEILGLLNPLLKKKYKIFRVT